MTCYTLTPQDRANFYDGAIRVWISCPSIVSPGEKFDIRVSLRNGQVAASFGQFAKDQGFDAQRKTFHLMWGMNIFQKKPTTTYAPPNLTVIWRG